MYQVTTDDQSGPQIEHLPPQALGPFAEARTALEIAPWGGESLNMADPDLPVRTLPFGPIRQGLITYLILEDQRRVDILAVYWLE